VLSRRRCLRPHVHPVPMIDPAVDRKIHLK
jgi:hypothetical protein